MTGLKLVILVQYVERQLILDKKWLISCNYTKKTNNKRPKYKRNTINTKMTQFLQSEFPNAKISFSSPTPEGEKFINKYTKMEK